jgi:hypothetical protein
VKIIEVTQGSPEWFAAKCGIPSASNFDRIICADGKVSKQRTKYLYQLAGEIITKRCEETYQSEDMLRSKEMEAEARKLYELITRSKVIEVGFCLSDGFGASPDGLIGKNGCLEIKCPKAETHVGYLLNSSSSPVEYVQQIQGQLLVTGREWVDFMSYYPGLRPFITRVKRDSKFIPALKRELEKFCAELKQIVRRLK